MQLSLFDYEPEPVVDESPPPVPRQPPAKNPRQQKKVYRCLCGQMVIVHISVVTVICRCGRIMKEG